MFVLEKRSLARDPKKKKKIKILLASASPRRRDLLRPFFKLEVRPSFIDESVKRKESPRLYVRRVALEKWCAAKNAYRGPQAICILSADTTVSVGGWILGKPQNRTEAKKMLLRLSGRTHQVHSAIACGFSSQQRPMQKILTTQIAFRSLSLPEIERYLDSKEWRGKAGAYGIQGKAMTFVSTIEGSLTNVIGLPLEETISMIVQSFSRPPFRSVNFGYHKS